MNELQIFKNEQFGEVRTIIKNGEPWFAGKDSAEILGYSNTRDALSRHVDEEDKSGVVIHDGSQNREMIFINESGLFGLILSSKLPNAKQFKRWVTSEVLPDIRKHGMYAKEELLDNPDLLLDVITRYKAEKEKNKLLDAENQLLAHQNVKWVDRKVLEALVKAYGSVVGFEDAWREFKKELLYMHGINLNARVTNYLNDTGKKTKPKLLSMITDGELPSCVSTAVAMCKNKNVKIDSIISKYQS